MRMSNLQMYEGCRHSQATEGRRMVFVRSARQSSSIQALMEKWSGHSGRKTKRRIVDWHIKEYLQAGGLELEGLMRYAVVIERAGCGFSAYVPDLPGCIAAGKSSEEVQRLIRGAIELHLSGLREDGEAVPAPVSLVEYIEIN